MEAPDGALLHLPAPEETRAQRHARAAREIYVRERPPALDHHRARPLELRAPHLPRRVQLVRRDGRDVSSLYGREGGGGGGDPAHVAPAIRPGRDQHPLARALRLHCGGHPQPAVPRRAERALSRGGAARLGGGAAGAGAGAGAGASLERRETKMVPGAFSCCQQRECTVGTWVRATVGRGGGDLGRPGQGAASRRRGAQTGAAARGAAPGAASRACSGRGARRAACEGRGVSD